MPAEYKMAAEQMAECLLNGIGVIARDRDRPPASQRYELDGWITHASLLVNKWFKPKAK